MEKVIDETHSVTDEIKGLPHTGDRISWQAVIAGAVIAMAIQLLLSSLGLAIGVEAVDPFLDQKPLESVGTVTGIWLGVSALISLLAGGYVAGRFSKSVSRFGGAVHGVLTWALVLATTFLLASTALGKLYGGFTSLLSGAGSLVASGVEKAVPDDLDVGQNTLATAQKEITQFLSQSGTPATLAPQALNQVGEDLQAIGQETVKDVVVSPGDAMADLNQALDKAYNRVDGGRGCCRQRGLGQGPGRSHRPESGPSHPGRRALEHPIREGQSRTRAGRKGSRKARL